MLVYLLLAAGFIVGFVIYLRKRKTHNPYAMSPVAAWVLSSAFGLAAAFSAFLVPSVLPYNTEHVDRFELIPVSRLVDGETRTYYVLENYNENGRAVHSWIADNKGETVLRSDFSLDEAKIIQTNGDDAYIYYTQRSADYPWVSPFAVKKPLLEATISIPQGSIYHDWDLPTDGD